MKQKTRHTHERWFRRRSRRVLAALIGGAAVLAGSLPAVTPTNPVVAAPPPLGVAGFGASGDDGGGNVGIAHPDLLVGADGRPTFNPAILAATGMNLGDAVVGWGLPASPNNTARIGFCVEQVVPGMGPPELQPDPGIWTDTDMAAAATLMQAYGVDNVSPYATDLPIGGTYNPIVGEFETPELWSPLDVGYTRRRGMAAHLGVRHHLGDTSGGGGGGPGASFYNGRIYLDAFVTGAGSSFDAISNALAISHQMSIEAVAMMAQGGPQPTMQWFDAGGAPIPQPETAGMYTVEISVVDAAGKAVKNALVMQWRDDPAFADRTSVNTEASVVVSSTGGGAASNAYSNANAAGWPSMRNSGYSFENDARFMANNDGGGYFEAQAAGTTSAAGTVRFTVDISSANYELGFFVQTFGDDVELYRGEGSQGNAVAADTVGTATLHVEHEADPFWLRFVKTSTDPALSVAGTEIALSDGSGDVIETIIVGADGIGDFAPVDPAINEPPYFLEELAAAPGLEATVGLIPIPGPYSTNPAAPSEIELANPPSFEFMEILKILTLDVEAIGDLGVPDDLSGFAFQVTRSDGADFGIHVTDEFGGTGEFFVTIGDYTVTEVARPAWAQATIDQGPYNVTVVPDELAVVEVDYVNVVPVPSLASLALTGAGDKYVDPAGDTVIDTSIMDRLLIGVGYTVTGELQIVNADGTTTPTGITGATEFVADATAMNVDIAYVIPAGSVLLGQRGVVFTTLSLTATGETVAEHHDENDDDQTFFNPDIGTNASDQSDSDKWFGTDGGTVIDVVDYCGLEPGVEYTVTGELQIVNGDGTATPTGIFGTATFVAPDALCGQIEVAFEIPPNSALAGQVGVVFETVAVTATGEIVAEHHDENDEDQTFYNGEIGTDLYSPGSTGAAASFSSMSTDLIDLVTYSGFAAADYRAELELWRRQNGVCTPTGTTISQTFTVEAAGSGTVEIGPIRIPEAGYEYVAYETIYVVDDNGDETEISRHWDCGSSEQTTRSISLESQVAEPVISAAGNGRMIDQLYVSGFLNGELPDGATAVVEGALFQHDANTPIGSRECTAANRVTGFTTTIDGDGTYTSPGEAHGLGYYSYNNRVVVDFGDGSRWVSDWRGCNEASESFLSALTFNDDGDDPELAEAGWDPALPVMIGGLLLVLVGAAITVVSRRGRRNDTAPLLEEAAN